MLHLFSQKHRREVYGLSDNSGLVYTPRKLLVVFSYKKKNPYDLTERKYNNLKEVYAFKFSKETLVS